MYTVLILSIYIVCYFLLCKTRENTVLTGDLLKLTGMRNL